MKIAIAQINTTPGDIEGNLGKVKEWIRRAARAGADLVAFPELSLSGRAPGALVREASFRSRHMAALREMGRWAEGITVAIGHLGEDERGGPTSAASIFRDGVCEAWCSGPSIGAPAEAPAGRVEDAAAPPGLVHVGGAALGFGVGSPAPGSRPAEPVQLLISLSADPHSAGRAAERERRWAEAARAAGVPVAVVNLVGGDGVLVFDGRSLFLDVSGGPIARAAAFEEDLLVVDLASPPAPANHRETDEVEELYAALRLGVADFVRKCGFRDVVLGLSGGIDSAVVAAIAADALGPEHVHALGMPSAYSSEATRTGAGVVAQNLGIDYRILPIEDVREAFERTLADLFEGTEPDAAEENVQARIRGTLLMAYANKFRALALATGNRSELAVGYCTLYGDTAGALAVIGDVPKTTVYRLAERINRHGEIIPRRVIELAPSAELKAGQTDRDFLPPYDVLDPILTLHLDERLDVDDVVARGYDRGTVRDVLARVRAADFKRRQAPPALRVISRRPVWPELPMAGRFGAGWPVAGPEGGH